MGTMLDKLKTLYRSTFGHAAAVGTRAAGLTRNGDRSSCDKADRKQLDLSSPYVKLFSQRGDVKVKSSITSWKMKSIYTAKK